MATQKLFATIYNPPGFHCDVSTRRNQTLSQLLGDMGTPRGWQDDKPGWAAKLTAFADGARPGDILDSNQVVIVRQRPGQ